MNRTIPIAAALGAAFLLAACGGAAAKSAAMGTAPPPPQAPGGYASNARSKAPADEKPGFSSDEPLQRDGDAIADRKEEAPEAPPPPPGAPAPSSGGGEAKTTGADTALEPTRDPSMIIYTARVTMAVYQVDQGLSAVEQIARSQGGFLSLKRDNEITVRIPRQKFDAALAAIDKIGDVLHRDVEAQDVTDQFVDLEIRIKNARAMQARLKALLDKAPVKEALEIEKELHRVTEELERMEGQLKLLRDKIAYSTITVMFQPRGSAIQSTRIRLPFPWLRELGLPSLLRLQEDK